MQLIIVATFYALPYYDGRATELGNDLKDLTKRYEQHPDFADITPATTFTTLAAAVIERKPDDPIVARMLDTHEAAINRLYDQVPSRSEELKLRTAA